MRYIIHVLGSQSRATFNDDYQHEIVVDSAITQLHFAEAGLLIGTSLAGSPRLEKHLEVAEVGSHLTTEERFIPWWRILEVETA